MARLIRRISLGSPDMARLKALVHRLTPVPVELPDSTSESREEERAA